MQPVSLNETGPISKQPPAGTEEDIEEAISDNYEDDFEDQSQKEKDDFFNEQKKKTIEKVSDPSQNSGLGFTDDYEDDFF